MGRLNNSKACRCVLQQHLILQNSKHSIHSNHPRTPGKPLCPPGVRLRELPPTPPWRAGCRSVQQRPLLAVSLRERQTLCVGLSELPRWLPAVALPRAQVSITHFINTFFTFLMERFSVFNQFGCINLFWGPEQNILVAWWPPPPHTHTNTSHPLCIVYLVLPVASKFPFRTMQAWQQQPVMKQHQVNPGFPSCVSQTVSLI